MQVRTKDPKKKRAIIFATVVGMMFVLVIWGFQLNRMFMEVVASEPADTAQYDELIEELEGIQNEIEVKLLETSEEAQELVEESEVEQESEIIDAVAQEAALRLQEQTTEEENIEDQTIE